MKIRQTAEWVPRRGFGSTLILSSVQSRAQEDTTTVKEGAVEQLKYKQQPGLALAASKIFFSDKRYSISGFGEFNAVPYQPGVNRDVGDLELYYSGLYRYATFFGYRFSDKIIWNSEFQVELVHDRDQEVHTEIVIEAFFDYRFRDFLNARLGFYPLTIGYVNNNDEPVMFYSVNRSEVERLIIPSTWIEFGTMLYGNITPDLSYALGFSQGLNSSSYLGGTWIRQGREIRFDVPNAISINPQLIYRGIPNVELSLSGYYGPSGQGEEVLIVGQLRPVRANISLSTGYATYNYKNFRFVTVGAFGQLSDTDRIFAHTANDEGVGQVLGEEVYGYLFEAGVDLLPWIRGKRTPRHIENQFVETESMKLSVFARYERLNTHHTVNPMFRDLQFAASDLNIVTTGVNFNTRENIVFKTNVQFVRNATALREDGRQRMIWELGVGFIF